MREYSAEVICALALLALVDWLSGMRLLRRPRFLVLLACLALGTLLFDGYLDARPVVSYGWRYLSGVRLWVVPLEDFGYGAALVIVSVLAWELLDRTGKRER